MRPRARARRRRPATALALALLLAATTFLALPAAPAAEAQGTFPGHGFLPDNRAWELVSPGGDGKNGADIFLETSRNRASADGDRFGFPTLKPFGDVQSALYIADYLARRTSDGWVSHPLPPAQESYSPVQGQAPSAYFTLFSSDLSAAIFQNAVTPLTDAPNIANVRNSYLRRDLHIPGSGTYEAISTATSPQPSEPDDNRTPVVVADATDDLGTIVFETRRNLTADAVAAGLSTSAWKTYKWRDGALTLVGVLPPDEGGGLAASAQVGRGSHNVIMTIGLLSADGSRVPFAAPPVTCFEGQSTGRTLCGRGIYLRDDQGTPTAADDTSTRINLSERTDCSGPPSDCDNDGNEVPARIDAATTGVDEEGNRVPMQVFFTTPEPLVDDDVNGAPDLYRWDQGAPAGSRLTLLSDDTEPVGDSSAESRILGVAAVSDSGDHVYFLSTDQLIAGRPTEQAPRLYLWHEGEIHHVGRR